MKVNSLKGIALFEYESVKSGLFELRDIVTKERNPEYEDSKTEVGVTTFR
jgi:hypothetical protein